MSVLPITLLYAPTFTVATLPTTGISIGAIAFATDGRAFTPIFGHDSTGTIAMTMQPPGKGTGVLVSYTGSIWEVVGTTIPVTA